MKNDENKIKDMIKGKRMSFSKKAFISSVAISPIAIPTLIKIEDYSLATFNEFIKFGNSTIFTGSGISNWWMMFICLGLVATGLNDAREIRNKKKEH